MRKDNILFTIIGLLIGLMVGFLATNSYNRSTLLAELQSQNRPPASQPQNQMAAVPQVAEALEKAEKEPNNFEAQIVAGDMFTRIDNFEKALPYYEKAHQIQPDEYRTLVVLGGINLELKRFKESQKWYEKALAKKSDDVQVRTFYGLSFFKSEPKDIDRAIKEYKTALAVKPDDEDALQFLAQAYFEKKDDANLKETIAKLEKVNPNNEIIKSLKESN
jgi:tetratricopeptide (TPR) repeat protein